MFCFSLFFFVSLSLSLSLILHKRGRGRGGHIIINMGGKNHIMLIKACIICTYPDVVPFNTKNVCHVSFRFSFSFFFLLLLFNVNLKVFSSLIPPSFAFCFVPSSPFPSFSFRHEKLNFPLQLFIFMIVYLLDYYYYFGFLPFFASSWDPLLLFFVLVIGMIIIRIIIKIVIM